MENDIGRRGCFSIDVNVGIQELKDLENQVAQLKCIVLIEINERDFRLERGFV